MAAATAVKVENPRNLSNLDSDPTTKDASSNIPATSSESDADKSTGKFEEVDAKTSDVKGSAAVTDIQKKMRRAERFGMSAKLTEEEKRNTRAERFGTGTAVNGSDSSKKAEDLKRKARAESNLLKPRSTCRVSDHMSLRMEKSTAKRPQQSCVKRFDALWFCYSPVHQMQQYYRLGALDNCSAKWAEFFDCLSLKTKTPAQVEVILDEREKSKPHIWLFRSPEEAASNWKNVFGHLDELE